MNPIDHQQSQDRRKGSSGPLSRRFIFGSVVFVAGFGSPVLIPIVLASGLLPTWKTALAGGLAFGIPELAMVVAVAIMGREGFQSLKQLIWGLFKRMALPDRVGRTRHRIGLVMFVLPLVYAWLGPYVEAASSQGAIYRIPAAIIGDVMFVASFFVLGGGFWDRLRALFAWDPVVQ